MGQKTAEKTNKERLERCYYDWEYKKNNPGIEPHSENTIKADLKDGRKQEIDRRIYKIIKNYYKCIFNNNVFTCTEMKKSRILFIYADNGSEITPANKSDIIKAAQKVEEYQNINNKKGEPIPYNEIFEHIKKQSSSESITSNVCGFYYYIDLDVITNDEYELYRSLIDTGELLKIKKLEYIELPDRNQITVNTEKVFEQEKWEKVISKCTMVSPYTDIENIYSDFPPTMLRNDDLIDKIHNIIHKCELIRSLISYEFDSPNYLEDSIESEENSETLSEGNSENVSYMGKLLSGALPVDIMDNDETSSASFFWEFLSSHEYIEFQEEIESIIKKVNDLYEKILKKSDEKLSSYINDIVDATPETTKTKFCNALYTSDETTIDKTLNAIWYSDEELIDPKSDIESSINPSQITSTFFSNFKIYHLASCIYGILKHSEYPAEDLKPVDKGMSLYNLKSDTYKYIIYICKSFNIPNDRTVTRTMFKMIKKNYPEIDLNDYNIRFFYIFFTPSKIKSKVAKITYQDLVNNYFNTKTRHTINRVVKGLNRFWKWVNYCPMHLNDFVTLIEAIYIETTKIEAPKLSDNDIYRDFFIPHEDDESKNILLLVHEKVDDISDEIIKANMGDIISRYYRDTTAADTDYYYLLINNTNHTLSLNNLK